MNIMEQSSRKANEDLITFINGHLGHIDRKKDIKLWEELLSHSWEVIDEYEEGNLIGEHIVKVYVPGVFTLLL
jgi:hypothetical protein